LFLLHLIRAHVDFQAAKNPPEKEEFKKKTHREREREREREIHDLMRPLQLQKQKPPNAFCKLPERGAPYPRSPLIWENKPRFCNGYHLATSGGLEGTL
jgi:hypothetical protein